MALVGFAAAVLGTWAVSALIGQMGGDPEGEAMAEIQKNQGLDAARAQRPLHSMQREIEEDEKELSGSLRRQSASAIRGQQNRLGRRSPGPQASLDDIAAQLGTTAEELSAKLSPERAGDLSSTSRIAFGRSVKRVKG